MKNKKTLKELIKMAENEIKEWEKFIKLAKKRYENKKTTL